MYLTDKLFNRMVKYAMTTDRLSATFSALADPTRRAILARLALGETTVSELAKPFKMSGPAVSKHLKVLERAGLIARSREAQMAALQARSGGAQAGRRLARRISPALGRAARSPRRLPEDAASQRKPREESVSATNSIDLERDPRSIIGTRVFDAPRDLVFSAFTDPKHLAQWWGPDGFTTTTSAFEFQRRRRLALRHARAGRPRLPEPHHLR